MSEYKVDQETLNLIRAWEELDEERCPECGCVESGCWEVGCMTEEWKQENPDE
jgi:hypothetical protein